MPTTESRNRMSFDKVERSILEELERTVPYYNGMDLDIIAHDQLKKRLWQVRSTLKRAQQDGRNLADLQKNSGTPNWSMVQNEDNGFLNYIEQSVTIY
jgi:hypothetical protein